MREQRIRDPVHNLIKFSKKSPDDEVLWDLIQTRPFQRLRRIKQLGFSDFVYPGAGHTRFSHSIGAMQMARRMLAVLERNRAIEKKDLDQWRRATLCAVLLHDLGHGPFSHVFEGISEHAYEEIHESHEKYTSKIIESTQVGEVLRKHGRDLFEKTLGLLTKDLGKLIYSRIVSGQLDADRLDFLTRDRYFTGIRFAEIDLEWLFDSLIVDEAHVDDDVSIFEKTFIISAKGRSVLEEYLASYAHMYSSVYFHKTTRGVEALVKEIFRLTLLDKKARRTLESTSSLFSYFAKLDQKKAGAISVNQKKAALKKLDQDILESYLALDDVSFLDALRQISDGKFGAASDLACRFFDRELFKCFEPSESPNTIGKKIKKFREVLQKKRIEFHEDITPSKGYKQFEISWGNLKNLLVKDSETEELVPIGTLNPGVLHLVSDTKIRFYFGSRNDRDTAKLIWKNGL